MRLHWRAIGLDPCPSCKMRVLLLMPVYASVHWKALAGIEVHVLHRRFLALLNSYVVR